MDGDLRDELVRVGLDGLYIDYFEDADARYTLQDWDTLSLNFYLNGASVREIWMAMASLIFFWEETKKHLCTYSTWQDLQSTNCQWATGQPTYHLATILITMETWMPLSAMTRVRLCSTKNRGTACWRMVKIQGFSELAGNYSAIWTDYNNDRRIDVYISKCLAETNVNDPVALTNFIKTWETDPLSRWGNTAGLADSAQTWTTAFEDFDNDGDMDAYVVNHDISNRLFRNNGDGSFTNVIAHSAWLPMTLRFWTNTADLNNDGYIDIVTDQKLSFLGNGDLTFRPVDSPVKASAMGDKQRWLPGPGQGQEICGCSKPMKITGSNLN